MVGKDAYFDLQIDKVSPSEALRALTLKKKWSMVDLQCCVSFSYTAK